MEEWIKVADYPDYEISNLGRVRSLKYGKIRILKDRKDGCGYLQVILCKNGKQRSFKVHTLVARYFLPNNDNIDLVVDHIDRCNTNNNINNLRWTTKSENGLNTDRHDNPMYGIRPFNGKYKVQMNVKRVMTYLGCFSTLEEAQSKRDMFLGRK